MPPRPPVTTTLLTGDCRDVLKSLKTGSVSAVVTDPPYAEVDRDYGRLTEPQWHELMRAVVPEVRRVLHPKGSAVFVLQPNSERVGRMRTWLWDFLAWLGREWNVVQDAYWFNTQAMPTAHCKEKYGLMRGAVKYCVWAGDSDCYRDQDAVLREPAESTKNDKRVSDTRLKYSNSGHHMNHSRSIGKCLERGAVPFNVLSLGRGGGNGHGAETPLGLCEWWVKYLTPSGGVVLDPFSGSGTVGEAASKHRCSYIGIEQSEAYNEIAAKRLNARVVHPTRGEP